MLFSGIPNRVSQKFNFYDNSKKQFCLNEAKLILFSGIPNRISQKAKKESKLKILNTERIAKKS